MLLTNRKTLTVLLPVLGTVAFGGELLSRNMAAAQQRQAEKSPAVGNHGDADAGKKANDGDQAKLQGTWKVSDLKISDVDPAKVSAKLTIVVKEDRLIWPHETKGGEDEWQFKLDSSKNPKQIDFQSEDTVPGGKKRTFRRLGIYSVAGDKLTICYSTVDPADERYRPTDFTAKDHAGRTLLSLERAKAE